MSKRNLFNFDEDLLYQINQVVVEAGHQLLKKKETEVLELNLKTDSYAVETNVHFPTDLNLLWDSSRKCLDTLERLQAITPIKIHSTQRLVKRLKNNDAMY